MDLIKGNNNFRRGMEAFTRMFQFPLDQRTLNLLEEHLSLLMSWNKVHNLTSVSDVESLVIEHYGDCLLAMNLWNPKNHSANPIFDLGAGNGFPGIVAAIMYPQLRFILVESSRKKCSFLRTAVASMNLSNVEVCNERVESLREIKLAITRAAFSEGKLNDIASSFSTGGELLLMTVPQFPSDEWRIDTSPWKVQSRSEYSLSSGARRSVVVLERK